MHKAQGQKILACCEKELLGKKLVEGKRCLLVKEDFYKEREATEKEVGGLLEECTSANIVGEKPIKIAKNKGFITGKEVKYISQVPIVQIYKL